MRRSRIAKKPRAMQVYLQLPGRAGICGRCLCTWIFSGVTPLDIFQPNRYFPAKHLPRPDPTEPRAGCVIDTGVLKLTVSVSAAGLSGTCKACRCGGCFAGRVHAGTGNAPSGGGGIFQARPHVKTWEQRGLQKRPCRLSRGTFSGDACSLVASKTPTYEPAPIASN